MAEIQYVMGGLVFACTVIVYGVLLALARRWRRGFDAEPERYWTAPKAERVADLTRAVWRPKLVSVLYALAYFTNGYNRVAFSVWIPLFLFQVRGLGAVEVALFVSLIYLAWGWKMFVGLVADALPLRFRRRVYRRLPWFLLTGVLYVIGTVVFVVYDSTRMPVWTVFLPTVVMITTAGAVFDVAADSYVVDATPPAWHGRTLGTASRMGRTVGGVLASVLPPVLIGVGGYRLVFLSAGLTGWVAFLCLVLKEPVLEGERVFTRKAIAFTFSEPTVLLGAVTTLLFAFSLRPVASPLGGMFTFILQEVVDASPELVGHISLVALLGGVPGSLLAGWAADKWGHKKMFVVSGAATAVAGLLWIPLQEGMVLYFTATAVVLSLLHTFNLACLLALMGDITPLALASTVFQMYMSFLWIGNVPMSILVGYLITRNLPLCLAFMSGCTVLVSVTGGLIKPFEAGKADKT
jgi:MFS family permease